MNRQTIIPPELEQRVRELRGDRALPHDFRAQRALRAQQPAVETRTISQQNAQNVYSARGTEDLPGKLVADVEKQATSSSNPSVKPCWQNTQIAIQFYEQLFGINLQRYLGGQVESSVDYSENYDNAFFNGEQMVYGSGDGTFFKDFCHDLSVVAHELGHAVVDSTVALVYEGQSGALNESYADVFAVALQQKQRGKPHDELNQSDWVIGEVCVVGEGAALRSFTEVPARQPEHPLGADELPRHMKQVYVGSDDNGGVHLNSTIVNHAFYQLCQRSKLNSWESPLQLWASLLIKKRIGTNASFAQFAAALRRQARAKFPALVQHLEEALVEVGL